MLSIGCHLSAGDGNLQMVRTAQSIGANTFAFFTRNNFDIVISFGKLLNINLLLRNNDFRTDVMHICRYIF